MCVAEKKLVKIKGKTRLFTNLPTASIHQLGRTWETSVPQTSCVQSPGPNENGPFLFNQRVFLGLPLNNSSCSDGH